MYALKTFLLTIGFCIFTHSIHAHYLPEKILVPCENSPPEAVLTIPEPLDKIASVQCTLYGHVITGSPEYVWWVPWTDSPIYGHYVPAQEYNNAELTESGHNNYFTSITTEVLADNQLESTFYTTLRQSAEIRPLSGSIISAINQHNFEIEIYIIEAEFEDTDGELVRNTAGYVVRSDLAPWHGYLKFFGIDSMSTFGLRPGETDQRP